MKLSRCACQGNIGPQRHHQAESDKKADAIRRKFQAVLDKMAAEAKS